MRSLDPDDVALWSKYTTDVKPLGSKTTAPNSAPSVRPASRHHPFVHTTLDLHGLTVATAFEQTHAFLDAAKTAHRSATVITGISGAIKREFRDWLENRSDITNIETLNGGGAFRVHFRKKKK